MDMNKIRKMCEGNMAIGDFLAMMYENTAEDGTLQVPYHHYAPVVENTMLLSTRMDWDLPRFEKAVEDFYAVVEALKALAPHCKALWDEGADPATLLADPALFQTYRTYGIPLDNGDFDCDRLWDINDRMDTIRLAQNLKEMLAQGTLDDEESRAFICDSEGVTVTEEECAYSEAYGAHLVTEAKKRMGDRPMAYDAYLRGQRLWRLCALGAPAFLLRLEERDFAVAFMLHRYGTEPEVSVLDEDWGDE